MAHRFQDTTTTGSATSISSDAPAGTSLNTTTSNIPIAPSGQIKPDVAKVECQKFLSTLLRLASEHHNVAINVKLLIQGLIDSILEPEEFTYKIQRVLNNSSPQPGLIRFLKMSLPYLRHSLVTRELTIEGITPPPNLFAVSDTVAGPVTPNEALKQNSIDVEMADIGEKEDEKKRMNCLCDDRQFSGLTIICGQCGDCFHCSCVGIPETIRTRLEKMEAQWFCPRCNNHKKSPTIHKTKLIQENDTANKLVTSTSLPPENSFSQPKLTTNMATAAINPKDNSCLEKGQNVASLVCRHCPFRTNSRQTLGFHEYLHSSIPPFKCFFCTITAESTSLLLDHVQLVHPEIRDKVNMVTYSNRKKRSTSTPSPEKEAPLIKVNEKVALASMINKETNGIASSGPKEVPSETPLIETKWDQTAQKEKKAQMIDVAKETNDATPEDESKLWCLCRQPVGQHFMVCCDGCEDLFHGSCVGLTPAMTRQLDPDGVKWFCPHCIRKDAIINHHCKVIQAMESLSTEFRTTSYQNSLPSQILLIQPSEDGDLDDDSGEPPNLNCELLSNPDETPSAPPDLQSDRETLLREETICRMAMEKLAEDICTGHEVLVKKANDLKEEAEGSAMLMSSTRKVDEIHRCIDDLEMKNRGESLERTVLTEFKERAQLSLKELVSQKIQLEKELNPLKELSVYKKIKVEFPVSHSSEIAELIYQKETLLEDVKIKLVNILKEENDFTARIRVVEEELAENARKLAQLRPELDYLKDNSAAGLPSANAIQMKTLKMKQRVRIAELSRLEKRLVQINCGFVLDEINQKEEEWTKAVDDYDIM